MVAELLLPRGKILRPKPPSYRVLDMAFGVGAGATLFDKSRYRSHGPITLGTWVQLASGAWVLDFTGVLDFVDVPATATQLDFTTEDFSLLFWIYMRAWANRYPINRGTFNANGWQMQIDGAGGVRFHTNQALANQVTNTVGGVAPLNTWVHIGITRIGAVAAILQNGVVQGIFGGGHIDPLGIVRATRIGGDDCRMGYVHILRLGMVTSEVAAVFNSERTLFGV